MLSPESAWDLIEAELRALDTVSVPRQQALGHVLAADVTARVDMPGADVSAMDGYIAAGEIAVDSPLEVRGVAAAGHPPDFSLNPGQVAKIMTGAMVPAGGDRVIPIEQTDGGNDRVVIRQAPNPGAHIRRQGEVCGVGGPLLGAGQLLNAGALSVLASHGYVDVPVHRRPKVNVLTTGDELVPPEETPGPGRLRDSNTSFLTAAGRSLDLDFESLGNAGDSPESLRAKIAEGLRSDVLLMSGGVSKGDFDLVEDMLEEAGCRRLFESVAMQPGKPLVAARHDGGWVFGLPGNPGSVMMTFWLFVKPLLRRLQGLADGYWQGALRAELAAPLPATRGRDRFFAGRCEAVDGALRMTPAVGRGSHDVAAYAIGNAVVRAPKRRPEIPAGSPCEVMLTTPWPLPLP